MIDLDDLQLSGVENVHLLEDGYIQIYGIKIADTEAEYKQEVVGIQYPPEFAIQLLDWLKMHEDILMEGCGVDISSDHQEAVFDADEDNDLDDALYDDLKSDDFDDEDDSFDNDELGADPYSPGYDPQD
jgi:hypothetical protein